MSSPAPPSTPTHVDQISRAFGGSGLDITFVSTVEMIERRGKGTALIKFGNYVMIMVVSTVIPDLGVNIDANLYFEQTHLVLNAHIFPPMDFSISRGDLVLVSGDLWPCGVRTVPKDDPEADDSREVLLTISAENIEM
ncbi:hypothetical protein K445DRAFT_8390 [Daldinia sp. EC12]|nr:hypothetical protein F4774DRAFT_410171 [Daldinia eschscholtzii]OTB19340.1 hypothetical protein K445DRAFT_8390 [Daldinia sp. EC12]